MIFCKERVLRDGEGDEKKIIFFDEISGVKNRKVEGKIRKEVNETKEGVKVGKVRVNSEGGSANSCKNVKVRVRC